MSSALLAVEARRGTLRAHPDTLPRTDLALARVSLLDVSGAIIEAASRLPDPLLRSLDAIHLATARAVRHDLDALLTYDIRLADAARAHGLEVVSPT